MRDAPSVIEAPWPGRPSPLGATFDGHGVNFAVYSPKAERIEVCLHDPADPARELRRFELVERTAHVWHGYVPGLPTGTLYGLRAYGPYDPARGLRFNGAKLLVDPYARAVTGKVDWSAPVHGYDVLSPQRDLAPDSQDDTWGVPKSVVVADLFDWGGDMRPETPWPRSVIYELHVRGFTMRHPGVPEQNRGTYAGLASPAAIDHLRRLGVTAVELLPVHEFVDDQLLVEKGLRNYWGYNTLSFFAPEQRYSSLGSRGGQVADFKEMVKALHRAGIEVIIDVVYNHTCEGNQLGPTLSLKGLANDAYYRLADDPRYYADVTGCGNTVDARHPQTLKLIMDSLRYWAEQMHVDGFRFDLATALCRDPVDFDACSSFLQAVHQDPALGRLKLIAEPWDVGERGYQVGGFPAQWSEWNGWYRDAVRRFWKGDPGQAAELGYRLTGSADLYALAGRKIYASVNFVTAHDGFTLRDLVSYNQKHNESNLEGNRDGHDDNATWNCGVEGETADPEVNELRERQQRNLIATLLLSQGVPMLCSGSEMGQTQLGNNNAYCHDDETTWLDWDLGPRRETLLDFTAHMIRLRLREPVLQRLRFFRGARLWDSSLKDLAWFRPDGREMTEADWQSFVRSLAFLLGGDAIDTPNERGIRIIGDTLLVLMNAHHEVVQYRLPPVYWGAEWEILVDTAGEIELKRPRVAAEGAVDVAPRSLMVLGRRR